MMKTETLHQAIDFVLGLPKCQQYITQFEVDPPEYAIVGIGARVTNYQQSIVQVYINFTKKQPDNTPEDVLIDVKGTNYGNFQVLHTTPTHLNP